MTNEELILEKLARIESRLDGVDRVEQQLQHYGAAWENLRDLGRDLSFLTEPAVKRLTEELADVETGFQLEDFFVLMKKLLPSLQYLIWALEQLENFIDWWRDMEPLLKLGVPKLVDYLDELEQKGIFRINAAVLEMYAKIATHYDAEDIAAMGDGFVMMHGMVKKLSDPRLIRFLEKFADLPTQVNLDKVKPVGPVGLMWRLRSPEGREGLGVLLELTRALGTLKGAAPEAAETETERRSG